ncbi:sensor histidine kinase [Sporosarcina sp. NCCP-2716]|uniref:ATP-binding protein n=1 Tax=Sporosarcina sp. NCCP-2716 TaxID=2943679 RepID=UPI00203C7C1E|nr:sensor histidine kinase [Sporosarcina sp. NCCP-2716]GKV69222.1 sensor histidine kinase [Sporosarcina sp. NCCP-2716]
MIRIRKEDLAAHRLPKRTFLNLHLKMIGLIGALVAAMVVLIGGFLSYFMEKTLEDQIGERALSVAVSVAQIPEVEEAFRSDDPTSIIQPIVARIQDKTDAEFIVVGNMEEIRYAHPNPDRIGKRMVGEDNERALQKGESYVSESTGTLGNSLRAKVPVYLDGDIVGVVSVGFLADNIRSVIWSYSKEIWMVLSAVLAAAVLGAIGISNYIKKALFGLEPEEISHLLVQKETILHSIHEGIVAVNEEGRITMINPAALQLLTGKESNGEQWVGKSADTSFPDSDLLGVLESGKAMYDVEKQAGGHLIYVNTVPIVYENLNMGAVSTFRNKTEIERLTKRLADVQQYADALRAQTHEFSNKLYTILGLTRLGNYDEVLEFIESETAVQDGWVQAVIDDVADPYVSGLLIGKLHQASELRIAVNVQPGSQLTSELTGRTRQALLTAIGNLLDNAFDAVYDERAADKAISLFYTDAGRDILFEVDDAGPGLADSVAENLFEEGVSTKGENGRGFGLAITKQELEAAGGGLLLEEGELGGACFVVLIPKGTLGEEGEKDG